MKKPNNLTPDLLKISKLTYDEIIKDKEITDEEFEFITKLHFVLFGPSETDRDKMINDIREISQWKIKVK